MRSTLCLLILLYCSIPAWCQINLVPNPSFEDTVYCPFGLDQVNASVGWSAYRNSPDYFSACLPNVPNTSFGFQHANSGGAYIGLATYYRRNSAAGGNYREYAGITLNSPLQIGLKYFVSFYAVLAERNTGFASNNLGLRFFTNAYSLANPAPINNISHLRSDSLLVDSINWTRVSGSFTADSTYQYLSIGNFYDYLNTDTLYITPSMAVAYYFVDDICVTTDSLYNETWTGLQNIEPNEVQIFPNPVQDYFQFQSIHKIDEVIIYDSRGRWIKSEKFNSTEGRINLGLISDGMYVALFRKEKSISVHKFLKF